MTSSTTWNGGNGDFNNPANWNNGVPLLGVDAFIDGTLSSPLTVTYASGADTANSLTTVDTSFNISGGSLTLSFASSLSQASPALAALTQTGGSIIFQNGSSQAQTSSITGSVAQSHGGTLNVQAGILDFAGAGSFAGSLTGAGTVQFTGGATYTLQSGVSVTSAALNVLNAGTTLTLATSLTYAGALYLDGLSSINLGGTKLTLTGNDDLRGLVTGGGTLVAKGTVSLNATNENFAHQQFTLGGTTTLEVASLVNLAATVSLGDTTASTAHITIDAGGTLNLLGNVLAADGAVGISNAGTLVNSTANAAAVYANVISTGVINASLAGGALTLAGGGTIGGVISGAGLVNLGNAANFTLSSGTILSVANFDIVNVGTSVSLLGSETYANSFYLDGGSTLALGSNSLTFSATSNADLRGLITGTGTLVSQGALALNGTTYNFARQQFTLGGGTLLDIFGTAHLYNTITLGDSGSSTAKIKVEAGALLDLVGNQISAQGTVSLVNAGTLENSLASSNSLVYAAVASTGTVTALAGASLSFETSSVFGGTLSGAGQINFGSGQSFTIAAGTVVSVAALAVDYNATTLTLGGNLSYAGDFYLDGNTELSIGATTLSLTAASVADLRGLVTGTGTLLAQGALSLNDTSYNFGHQDFTLGGAATLEIAGTTSILNTIIIGDNGTSTALLKIDAGGTVNIGGDNTISANGSGALLNAGTLEKTAGSGTGVSLIYATVTNTGTITDTVAGNILEFAGGGSFAGSLTGAGTIDFGGGHAYSWTKGLLLSAASLGISDTGTDVTLSSAFSYGGTFSVYAGAALTLAGTKTKLTLTGASGLHGIVNGTGQVVISGATAQLTADGLTLGGSVALVDSKALIAQAGQWTIGDGATSSAHLQVLARSTYQITADVGIGSNGTGAISNAGLFEKVTGNGVSVITPLVSNSGTVLASSGTLDFTANYTNTGLSEATTGALTFGASVTNDGTILATDGHAVNFASTLISDAGKTGIVDLSNGGLANFGGFVGSAESLTFVDTSVAQADISQPGNFSAIIAGFAGSNVLDFAGIQNVTGSYSGNTSAGVLTLTEVVGGTTETVAQLHFAGNYSFTSFALGNDASGGTFIHLAGH